METPIERYCCVAMSTLQGVAEQMVEYSVETMYDRMLPRRVCGSHSAHSVRA